MTAENFLSNLLNEQQLEPESAEYQELEEEYQEIKALLHEELQESNPDIVIGGSLAKETIVRASYDLDVICYFQHDDNGAGDTLKEIRGAVRSALKKTYQVEDKRSAIQLIKRRDNRALSFSIDVVPGRYVDDHQEDVFLYQGEGEKERLKTNLQKHIDHIKGSKHVDIIRLAKIWKLRSDLNIKTFVLELLVIECLEDSTCGSLSDRLIQFWEILRDDIDSISIEDPANPSGNELSLIFGDEEKDALSTAATIALDLVDEEQWTVLFGDQVIESSNGGRAIVSQKALIALGDTSHVKRHSWPVRRGAHQVSIACVARKSNGKQKQLANDDHAVIQGTEFIFSASTNVPRPFDVRWQVVNTGSHALDQNCLRGREFIEKETVQNGGSNSGLTHRENAAYTGKHWVECFIVKEGFLWAKSGSFYVNIINTKRRKTKWFSRAR